MRKFPRSLLEALSQGRVLPFVGAGVSRSVLDRQRKPAFPTWVELLERAGEWLREEQKPEEAESLVQSLTGPRPDFLAAAQIARAGLSGRRWGDFLRRQFNLRSEQIDPASMDLARAIWSLGSNLLITTNYDRVLEWACERSTDCHCWPTHAPAEHTRAIEGIFEYPAVWHIHGTIQQLDSIILTTDDYQRLYPLERGEHVRIQYESALFTLRNLLAIKHFLFIGYSFSDHSFLEELLHVNEAFRGNIGPHYALIHANERERMLPRARELGLELICFDDFGPPLVRTIRELASAQREARPPQPTPASLFPPVPVEPRELRPNFLLGQRFRLEHRLGHGGFATVWQAIDERDQTPVAVKILHSHLNDDPGRISRFSRGAERMSALQHPNVVRVLAPVATDGSFTYFVMELMPIDLHRAVLHQRPNPQQIVSIVRQVGLALSYAHQLGLIHRDVKPGNILLDAHGAPRLTDFDLVLVRDSSGGTRTGGLGTFLFAAPEVIADPANADETADVFGLAMTAVFMFHGAPLRPDAYRNAAEFIEQNLQCKHEVKMVLARGCAWKCERRQRNIAEFCEQLQLAHLAPESSPASVPSAGSASGIIQRLRQFGPNDAPSPKVHGRAEHKTRMQLRDALSPVDTPFDKEVPLRAPTPALPSSPAPTMTSTSHPPLPPQLVQAKRAGKLVPFVGAGLSLGADVKGGYPDWRSVAVRLLDKCDQLGVWQSDVDREWLRLRFLQDDPLAPAGFTPRPMALRDLLSGLDDLKQRLGREYREALSTIFRPHDAAPGVAHTRVKELGLPLVLTTNFDQLLEAAEPPPARQVYHWKRSSHALADIKGGHRVLFKVHGSAEDEESVVLTWDEYASLRASLEYRRVMDYLVVDHTFLFVGYGMVDPYDLDIILAETVANLKSASTRHYALLRRLPNEQAEIDRRVKLLDEHRVHVIAYDDHQEVTHFLAALARV